MKSPAVTFSSLIVCVFLLPGCSGIEFAVHGEGDVSNKRKGESPYVSPECEKDPNSESCLF